MRKIFNTLLLAAFVAAIVVVSYWIGQQAYSWMPQEATAEAKLVDDLFSFLVTLGAVIFFGIIGTLVYSILAYRVPRGDTSVGHPARGDVLLEILWTAIPTVLVLWIAVQGYNIYQQLNIQGLPQVVQLPIPWSAESADAVTLTNNPKPLEVEVVAKQWAWSFRYPGRNVTSTELHLPLNHPVRLALHSEDVLHGFYVPEFRLKQDIIPNRTITLVLTPIRMGKYRLSDSQFSGTYFALMQADVYVDSPDAYNRWLAATREPTIASNQAASEHTQLAEQAVRSGWPTVVPAQPTVAISVERKVINDE